MTAYGHEVDDVSMKLGGKQRIVFQNHGGVQRIFPLRIENWLCHLPQRYPSIEEMNTLPQQIMTGDQVWDPFLFNTNMTLGELIKSFPISTEKEKGFYDEEDNLILQVSEAVQKDPDSDEPLPRGSENDFFTLENSTSKEVICTFQNDTSDPSSPVQFSVHNTKLDDIVVETVLEDNDTVTLVKDDVISNDDQFDISGDHKCDQFSTSGDQFDDLLSCASGKCQFENSENFENSKSDDASTWSPNINDPDFSHVLSTSLTTPPDDTNRPTSRRTSQRQSKTQCQRWHTNKHHSLRHQSNTNYLLCSTDVSSVDQPSFVHPSVFTDVGLSELHYNNAVWDTSDDSVFYDVTGNYGSTDDDLYINFCELTLSNDQDSLDL